MSKNKVKLLLVEDYIELNKIHLMCKNFKILNCTQKDKELLDRILDLKQNLIEVYEKIFFRFGLMDMSYLLLKKNFSSAYCAYNIVDLDGIFFRLEMIKKTITLKLEKLALNEIEMKYVIQNLSV